MARVLVVDDNASFCRALGLRLEDAGCLVDTAASAADAIKCITGNYDVLVVDMRMETEESGLEVLQSAKSNDRFCQVIVLTAYAELNNALKAMSMGAFAYVLKEASETEMVLQQVKRAVDFHAVMKNLEASSKAIKSVRELLEGVVPLLQKSVAQLGMVRDGQDKLLSTLLLGGPQEGNPQA